MKILICDDHAVFRDGVRQVLEHLDATFLEADDGESALATVEAEPELDLLLLDLQMPGLDGWRAFEVLRRDHGSVPVVIVSSSEDPSDVQRALSGGASGFVAKSSSREVLRAAFDLILAGGVYVPPFALGAAGGGPETTSAADRRRERAAGLTPRQLQVLQLMSRGLTNKEIAGALEIAESTVKTHIGALLEALDVTNRTEASLVMHELGLDD